MTDWRLADVHVERTYEIIGAPDLQDSSSPQRRVLRPRKVTMRQEHGVNRVWSVFIEGLRVRRDGGLGDSIVVPVGLDARWPTAPPEWLNRLLADEGLQWAQDGGS